MSRRRGELSPQKASAQEVGANIDGQIMAILHQTKGVMPPSPIRVALGLSIEKVAVALRRLEEQNRVLRAWQPNEHTLSVRTA